MSKFEFKSEEDEKAANEMHNQLLTVLACDYLHEKLCTDYFRRFSMNSRKLLTTPWERSLQTPQDIFDALEKKGSLCVGKYDTLLDVVKGIDVRMDEFIRNEADKITARIKEIKTVRDGSDTESSLQRKPTEKELAGLSRLIGFDFQLIGAELGVDTIKMQHIVMNHPGDAQTQVFQMLIAWKQKESKEATVEKLLTVLKNRDVDFEKVKSIFNVTDSV